MRMTGILLRLPRCLDCINVTGFCKVCPIIVDQNFMSMLCYHKDILIFAPVKELALE